MGFPRYKRRKHQQGYLADNGPGTVCVDGKAVILPKIGRVVMLEQLRFRGSIRKVKVNRTSEVWFASFCVEDGEEPPPVKDGQTVGVDVGLGTMATCSDGMAVENPKALAPALQRQSFPLAGAAAGQALEILHVKGMILNRRLALAIADAGMSGFLASLEY